MCGWSSYVVGTYHLDMVACCSGCSSFMLKSHKDLVSCLRPLLPCLDHSVHTGERACMHESVGI